MLTSDLTSLVPPQFSPWLQVRKLAPFIYHLSSIMNGNYAKKKKPNLPLQNDAGNAAYHINDAENESHLATRQNESESKQIDKGAGFAYSARKSVQNSNY